MLREYIRDGRILVEYKPNRFEYKKRNNQMFENGETYIFNNGYNSNVFGCKWRFS